MISLIPEDVGKPTVRLEKAAVREGTCTWENPIYETVKLIKEKKTGIIHEKIYRFIVSTVRIIPTSHSVLHFLIGFLLSCFQILSSGRDHPKLVFWEKLQLTLQTMKRLLNR